MNYTVFNGASFRVTDVVNEKQHIAMILAMSAVKQLWPVRRYQIPDLVRATNMSTPKNSAGSIDFIMDEQANSTGQSYSPHAMTQVDRLHAKGCKSPVAQLPTPLPLISFCAVRCNI